MAELQVSRVTARHKEVLEAVCQVRPTSIMWASRQRTPLSGVAPAQVCRWIFSPSVPSWSGQYRVCRGGGLKQIQMHSGQAFGE